MDQASSDPDFSKTLKHHFSSLAEPPTSGWRHGGPRMHELFSPEREEARLSNWAQPDVDPGMIMPDWNAASAWMARLVVSQLLPVIAK